MATYRPSLQRGHAQHGWLDSYHTFSFADFHDPKWMEFSTLRVINEDVVAPGMGFGMHPHRDMEIITWVLAGRLHHKDSLGNSADIVPGEFQRMTAGTGIVHSEFNPSSTEPVHLLQIWLQPNRRGLPPGYAQQAFPLDRGFRTLGSHDGRAGSLMLNSDAALSVARLAAGESAPLPVQPGRRAWIQVAKGAVRCGSHTLTQGDGLALEPGEGGALTASEASEVLVFDLP